MAGYVVNIEDETLKNEFFRKVLFTAKYSQLVVMTLKPSEDIGEEVHDTVDQFIRIEMGIGKAVLDGREFVLSDGTAVVIPAGVKHNIINTSVTAPMKLYTIYTPPEHKDGIVHKTKAEAKADTTDHFGG
jgi:mannose-6-phosphate isomerase-like protein (cupin superfamily)